MAFTPERTTVFQNVNIGKQTSIGTPASTFSKLASLSIKPSPKIETFPFTPQGTLTPTLVAIGKDMVEAKIEGSPIYEELDWLLGSLLCKASAGVYNPSNTSCNTPEIYTIQTGESGNCEQFSGAVITGATFTYNRSSISISGDMIGKALDTGVWSTTATAAENLTPVLPMHVTVKLDGTAMSRCFNAEVAITNRWKDVWTLNAAETSYVNVVETLPTATIKMGCEMNTEGRAILTELRADNSTRTLSIEAAYNGMSFMWEARVKVGGIDELKDEDGVYAVTYTWNVVYDEAAGYSIKATLDTTPTA